jgi:folate-binding protein YgfZ
MPHQNPDFIAHLRDRAVIHVTGPDAETFLQNVMTNDMARLPQQGLLYSCLLSPQGQYLHDFFVTATGDGFLVDIDAGKAEDFLRRIAIFKLRAKVNFNLAPEYKVYAGKLAAGHDDPRQAGLGKRLHATADISGAVSEQIYEDWCISKGVPGTSALKLQKDVLADVNLDLLNAVAWDKGCYIGQEVTARMRYKALAKKRLFIVNAAEIPAEAGEIRQINASGKKSLAILKLSALHIPDIAGKIELPLYLKEVVKI